MALFLGDSSHHLVKFSFSCDSCSDLWRVDICEVKGSAFLSPLKSEKTLINQGFSLAPQVGFEPTPLGCLYVNILKH